MYERLLYMKEYMLTERSIPQEKVRLRQEWMQDQERASRKCSRWV